jgi:pimeloyl-ACP methyl ester carboxylesterase
LGLLSVIAPLDVPGIASQASHPIRFNDPDSIATEMRNAARPWGFDLDEVTAPTVIWQGGLDDVHTPAMADHLARHLPRATLNYEADYATFNFIDDVTNILTTLENTA